MIDGTQAEYVRTPVVPTTPVPLPDNVNEEVALLLSDALPTARNRRAIRRCQTWRHRIHGAAAPVGMSALLTAQLYSPAAIIVCDMDEKPFETGERVGRDPYHQPRLRRCLQTSFCHCRRRRRRLCHRSRRYSCDGNMCQDIVKPGRSYRRCRRTRPIR